MFVLVVELLEQFNHIIETGKKELEVGFLLDLSDVRNVMPGFLDLGLPIINENRGKTMALTKADIINALYGEGQFIQKETVDFVELVLEQIKEKLEKGEEVKIANFGKFKILERNERPGRNPKTREEYNIPARKVVRWYPSPNLRKKFLDN